MRIYLTFILICTLCLSTALAQKLAFQLYDSAGTVVSYERMLSRLDSADVILFGEIHNDALAHWLELQLAKDLYELDTSLVLGAEMLETDDQLLLNEYLTGTIEARHFEEEAKLWNNYGTDYAPLVSFARQHQIPFIATNIPRRYASLVSREGLARLDSLPEAAKELIAPLPIEVDLSLPGYKNMLDMMGGTTSHGGMSAENMASAQAIKDATMAHFILLNLPKETTFLHFNGSYHSDNFEGIYWYIQQAGSDVKVKTISCVSQSDIGRLEEKNTGMADFIIALPEDMTKTYWKLLEWAIQLGRWNKNAMVFLLSHTCQLRIACSIAPHPVVSIWWILLRMKRL